MLPALKFALVIPAIVIPMLLQAAPPYAVAQANTSSIPLGELLPECSGQTLAGKSLKLPDAAQGQPVVVIFAFSKAAGKDARSWSEHLSKDFSGAVPSYTVISLESAPKIFRGMAISGIKSSMPPSMQDRTIILYRDETLWKQRLAFSVDNRAYVVVLGADGHLQWSNEGAFSESAYRRLESVVGGLLSHRS